MNNDVNIGIAFIAGLISFISPCVLPLIPAYVSYMGGHMTQQVTQLTPASPRSQSRLSQRFSTFSHGLFFVLGFTLFFVVFGLLTTAAVSSLTSLGATEAEVRQGIARVGGTTVILFGLHVMGILNRVFGWLLKQTVRLDRSPYGNVISTLVGIALIGVIYWLFIESWLLTLLMVLVVSQVFRDALKADTPGEFWGRIILQLQTVLYQDTRRQDQPANQYGYLGSLFMGIVFAAGWTPCIGPAYGAVLTLASSGEDIPKAGMLLATYSLGLGIPFLLTALALDQAQAFFRRLQKHMRMIELFSGLFLLVIGVLVFSGQLERLTESGTQGRLGEISLNLERCTTGALRGHIRLSNVRECISAGTKEDFYIEYSKTEPATAAPAVDDTALSSPGPGSATAAGGVVVPELTTPEVSVLDLATDTIPEGLAVGQRAPDFSAELLDGQRIRLSVYRGQVVLLNFWATWCAPCRTEMPDFQTVYDLKKDEGFVILAVNYLESPNEIIPFVENDIEVNFPIVLDESGAIGDDLYGEITFGLPASLLIDQSGVITAVYQRQVHGSELLTVLEDLLAS